MGTYVVVLGFGQVTRELNWRTMLRVEREVTQVIELRKKRLEVTVILPTGSGKREAGRTMASAMGKYALELLSTEDEVLTRDVNFVVNHDNPAIWGTVHELRWARMHVRKNDKNAQFKIVTNARHGRRVLLTNRIVTKISNCSIVPSSDPPSILFHEILGYAKLMLYAGGATRLINLIERFRRKHYSIG